MKKLLVLALSAIMVLAMATVSMAVVNVNGELNMKYDFKGEKDQQDGKINFESKLNDEVTAFVSYQWDSDAKMAGVTVVKDAAGTAPTTNAAIERNMFGIYANEAYLTMKKSFGTMKFGNFEVKPYGSQIYDNADTYAPRMKAPFIFNYAAPSEFLPEGFKANVTYFRDNNDLANDFQARALQGAGAYVLNFGYANKLFGADYWRVDYGDPASGAIYSQDFSNVLYVWVKPVDFLRVKAQASENGGDFARMLGFDFSIPGIDPLSFQVEKYWWEGDVEPFAYLVAYKLDNGVTFDVRSKDAGAKGAFEFRVKMKFK